MRCAIRFPGILFCLMSIALCRIAGAQNGPPPPLLPQLFKQPTGQNGFEDLAMACDLLTHNAAMRSLLQSEVTLTTQRRALAEPDLQRALALLRVGLGKQMMPPSDPADPATPLPQIRMMIGFIDLAELLATETYVSLADGHTARAIQNLRLGLLLGCAVRCQSRIVSGRTGIEIDRILINLIARHLDQFAEHECDSLLQVVQERLAADCSPLAELLDERKQMQQELAQLCLDPVRSLQELRDETDPQDNPTAADLLDAANPTRLVQASAEAAAMCGAQVDAAIANLNLPPWQRQDWKWPVGDTLAHRLYLTVAPDLDRALQRYDEDRARLQLFAVHVALRRHRWQYDRLPERLEQLRLDALTIDPFTGKPLPYRTQGDDYELYSIGPVEYASTGVRDGNKHTPVVLSR